LLRDAAFFGCRSSAAAGRLGIKSLIPNTNP